MRLGFLCELLCALGDSAVFEAVFSQVSSNRFCPEPAWAHFHVEQPRDFSTEQLSALH